MGIIKAHQIGYKLFCLGQINFRFWIFWSFLLKMVMFCNLTSFIFLASSQNLFPLLVNQTNPWVDRLMTRSMPISLSESGTLLPYAQTRGTKSHFKCHMRFWEYSSWSQDTFRTVYLSSLRVCQTTRCSVCLGPHLFWKVSLFLFVQTVILVWKLVECASPTAICMFWGIEENLVMLPHVRITVTSFQCPIPRTAVGGGQDCVMAL